MKFKTPIKDTNLYILNCTIYNDSAMTNAVWSYQINLTGNETYTKTAYVDVSTWPDGTYYENCTISDRI